VTGKQVYQKVGDILSLIPEVGGSFGLFLG